MLPDDRIRLRHMADAIESALRFSRGRSRAQYESDEMLLFAVVRAVEVVGEAASRTTTELRVAHPQIPWAAVVGMRNRLVHRILTLTSMLSGQLSPKRYRRCWIS